MNLTPHPLFLQALSALQVGNALGAKTLLKRLLQLAPKNSDALHLMGIVCGLQKKPLEAIEYLRRSVKLSPNDASVHFNLAKAFSDAQLDGESVRHHMRATELDSLNPDGWVNYGKSLDHLRRPDEALICYDKAIELKPDMAEPWFNRGKILSDLKRYEEALDSYEKAYAIRPNESFLLGILLHHQMLICRWDGLDELYRVIQEGLLRGEKVAEPFGFQAISDSEEDLRRCAEIFSNDFYPAKPSHTPLIPQPKKEKIRIAYVCGEFRAQATSVLMTGLYEMHNKDIFEIYAFDNGWDDGSKLRERINKSFTQIIDITAMTDMEVANTVSQLQIDILVNLNGFFGKARQGIFALRAAPIQVNYLGFPGTLGASYMDYIIADGIVLPKSSEQFYVEKVIALPDSYQANDHNREISSKIFNRVDEGLPETGFVFCCFNNNYKITPTTFDSWMRILTAVEGSILWLIEDNPYAVINLKKEAEERGVAGDRLIFAKRLPLTEHLARHHLANLFLDTLPYNAHTTASDALWAGVPILTCMGKTFPGRVGASLLHALDLPELITYSTEEYEAQAVKLALNTDQIEVIKNKLAENTLTQPLFDSRLFARNIEDAYLNMYQAQYEKAEKAEKV
jgi:predicted O-linked N-acetylglucosamine transferase (SPINDLY family)